MKVCAFFGHRECFGLDESRLEAAIERAIVEYGCSVFWCGGMGAFDWLAARKVRSLKARYPHIRCVRVYAYLPVGKDPDEERCDESFLPDGLETVPRRAAIPRRNAWMARHCHMAITFLNVSQSGAYAAASSVHRAGKPVIHLGSLRLESGAVVDGKAGEAYNKECIVCKEEAYVPAFSQGCEPVFAALFSLPGSAGRGGDHHYRPGWRGDPSGDSGGSGGGTTR